MFVLQGRLGLAPHPVAMKNLIIKVGGEESAYAVSLVGSTVSSGCNLGVKGLVRMAKMRIISAKLANGGIGVAGLEVTAADAAQDKKR